MKTAEVEAIRRTKNRRAELMQLYEEDKELDVPPNNDDTVKEKIILVMNQKIG